MAEFKLSKGSIENAYKLGGLTPDGVLRPLAPPPDPGLAVELPEDEEEAMGAPDRGQAPPMTLEELRANLSEHMRHLNSISPADRAEYFSALRLLTPLVKALAAWTPEETPDVNHLPEIVAARDEFRVRVRTALEKERVRRSSEGVERCLGCGRALPIPGERSPAQELIDACLDSEGR